MNDLPPMLCRELLRQLTPRQREVARAIATGAPRKELCGVLGMSYHTMDKHVRAIYGAWGFHNEVEMVRVVLLSRQ